MKNTYLLKEYEPRVGQSTTWQEFTNLKQAKKEMTKIKRRYGIDKNRLYILKNGKAI